MADIYELAEEQKAALLARERAAASELVRAYGKIYQRIQARVSAVTAQIDDARGRGEIISSSFLYEQDRLTNLKFQIERELRRFSAVATTRVTAGQGKAVEQAASDAESLVRASLEAGQVRAAVSFGALDADAMASIVGFSGDGSPLRVLFDRVAPQMAVKISDELVAGVAEGIGAREIAGRIRKAAGVGLARSILIARQETLRAYRTATLANYEASGMVTSWRWFAARNAHTCAVCWAMDGKEFSLKVKLNSHPGCRCTLIPVTDATPPAETGIDAFGELEPGVQKQILGLQKYEAFKAGKFSLENLVGVRYSPEWGTVRFERSLKDLIS